MRLPCPPGLLAVFVCCVLPRLAAGAEPAAVERGRQALLGRHFTPLTWSADAYRKAWRVWGEDRKEAPADYDAAFRERYGLHAAPYANDSYPMGLREAPGFFSKGMTSDCLLCHGGSIFGKSYVGLGNATLDIQALFDELNAAEGRKLKTPFAFANVRGTTEAGGFAVYLLGWREPDLRLRTSWQNLGLSDDLCEDTPAWWLLKKKKTMYYTGGADARSVRSIMQFMMSPLNPPSVWHREESTFRDIQAYLLSIEAPKYPLTIDHSRAAQGEQLFGQHCAKCHGTYGEKPTYPNKIIPLEVIGTDRRRYEGITRTFAEYYNRSWFAQEKTGWLLDDHSSLASDGYQAPPLDGVWATAPYLHNGSVPTLYHVLNSQARPRIFTRSYHTEEADYDPIKVGWKIEELPRAPGPETPARERRRVYDTTASGRGNGGHTFGDKLTEEERLAVIEYLKTL